MIIVCTWCGAAHAAPAQNALHALATCCKYDGRIPEEIWEVTYRAPNGDDHWLRTPTMCFEDACKHALAGISSERKLIRIERVPTTAPKQSHVTTVVG